MPASTLLGQTATLQDTYLTKLKDGSITDAELTALLQADAFKASTGYVNTGEPTSNTHFSASDGVKHFVQTVGPQIPEGMLHALNTRMLILVPKGDANTYLRNSLGLLAKTMLAYELFKYPKEAEKHFTHPNARFLEEFGSPAEERYERAINNLKAVILKPSVDFFNAPIVPIIPTTPAIIPATPARKSLAEVAQYYTHAVNPKESGRSHLYRASTATYTSLASNPEYSSLTGDSLKTKILENFKEQLEACSTKGALLSTVARLKETDEYQILSTGQGLFTRTLGIETSSVKAFNQMVKGLSANLDDETLKPPSSP